MDDLIASDLERTVNETPVREERNSIEKYTDWYFRPKAFERWNNGRIYEYLGIKHVKKALMGTLGKRFRKMGMDKDKPNTYFIGRKRDKTSIKKYELKARINEAVHTVFGLHCSYYFISDLIERDYSNSTFEATFFVLNASLLMLQRYNRAIVYNVLERRNKKK